MHWPIHVCNFRFWFAKYTIHIEQVHNLLYLSNHNELIGQCCQKQVLCKFQLCISYDQNCLARLFFNSCFKIRLFVTTSYKRHCCRMMNDNFLFKFLFHELFPLVSALSSAVNWVKAIRSTILTKQRQPVHKHPGSVGCICFRITSILKLAVDRLNIKPLKFLI